MNIQAGRKSSLIANTAVIRSEIRSLFQKNLKSLQAVIRTPQVQAFRAIFHQVQAAIPAAHPEAVLGEVHPEEVAQAEAGNFTKMVPLCRFNSNY